MKAYLDSSVLIAIAFREAKHIANLEQYDSLMTSRMACAECFRTLHRLNLERKIDENETVARGDFFRESFRGLILIDVSTAVINRAMESFGIYVKTLDAIHLSTALLWQEQKKEELTFLTHDERQEKAARLLGFSVGTKP